ncbi:MAG: glycoside hydrolase family 2 protein [Deltaproteobacteria bacterium]|nr:glycoside hydrolase family 2 protein [Deltaproteobacteria bacterium]
MSLVRAIEGHELHPVSAWQACATAPDAVSDPASTDLAWGPEVAGAATTAAAMLRAAGAFSLDGPARRFDGEDWWFRARLPAVTRDAHDELVLELGGIATVADVWIDGARVLESDNMFRTHAVALASPGAELVIRCRALDKLLGAKRPRPRWRAPMIENQQLRWFRTTLLGRTPGWTPPVPPVGPWRGAVVRRRRGFAIDDVSIRTSLSGDDGVVEVTCAARALGGVLPSIELVVEREGREHRATLGPTGGRLVVPSAARWWPHTHGEPALYAASLRVGSARVDLGKVGFRTIARDGDFSLAVNGTPIFCRGACWMPIDIVTLAPDRAALARALVQARDAGMNMLRISGTMTYESDDFHDLCDELGILVFQDFMFANMDYPEDDAAFAEGVTIEANQVLARIGHRPSLAVLCGNSEGEQQAAMFGAPRERWSPRLFHGDLAALAAEHAPGVVYWPSSAHGGAFPHEPRVGTTSYYGVGAYLRSLDDARRSEVRFATECLAFANVPEAIPPALKVHHPSWKARTPRDLGAGWDFDDVRDHYVQRLFGVDPAAVRYADHERYLALGRAATGEVMAQVFAEWRRPGSTCRGGLVWFLRDLWQGSGWGVVDAAGTPKSPYWYLRRALAPVSVHVSDEGNNGLYVHVVNDRGEALEGELELSLFRAGEVTTGSARRAVKVPARGGLSLNALEAFDGFLDLSFAYRFGPPSCDLVVVTLRAGGARLAEAFHFPVGLPSARELDVGLAASAVARDERTFEVTVKTRRFAQAVVITADGFEADDAWFHLAPGGERSVVLSRAGATGPLKGVVGALNSEATPKIAVS